MCVCTYYTRICKKTKSVRSLCFPPLQTESQDSESVSPEVIAESVHLAVEYNAKLAEQRRTTRQMYLDTQTKVHIHVCV